MDGFFKINCYPIIFLLSLFSLQSPFLLSWFSLRHGFLYEIWFLHVFSSLLINSPANSTFCLCGTIFNAIETSWVGGLGLPSCLWLAHTKPGGHHASTENEDSAGCSSPHDDDNDNTSTSAQRMQMWWLVYLSLVFKKKKFICRFQQAN